MPPKQRKAKSAKYLSDSEIYKLLREYFNSGPLSEWNLSDFRKYLKRQRIPSTYAPAKQYWVVCLNRILERTAPFEAFDNDAQSRANQLFEALQSRKTSKIAQNPTINDSCTLTGAINSTVSTIHPTKAPAKDFRTNPSSTIQTTTAPHEDIRTNPSSRASSILAEFSDCHEHISDACGLPAALLAKITDYNRTHIPRSLDQRILAIGGIQPSAGSRLGLFEPDECELLLSKSPQLPDLAQNFTQYVNQFKTYLESRNLKDLPKPPAGAGAEWMYIMQCTLFVRQHYATLLIRAPKSGEGFLCTLWHKLCHDMFLDSPELLADSSDIAADATRTNMRFDAVMRTTHAGFRSENFDLGFVEIKPDRARDEDALAMEDWIKVVAGTQAALRRVVRVLKPDAPTLGNILAVGYLFSGFYVRILISRALSAKWFVHKVVERKLTIEGLPELLALMWQTKTALDQSQRVIEEWMKK